VLYLIGFALSSTALFLNFRWFETWNIQRLPVICLNYLVCTVVAFSAHWISSGSQSPEELTNWWFWPFLVGCMFLANFFLTSRSVEQNGVQASSVATKTSLLIPFVVSLALNQFRDFNLLGLGGLVLGLLSILFVGLEKSHRKTASIGNAWILLVAIFIGTGSTDILSQLCVRLWIPESARHAFIVLVFASAFLGSFLWILFQEKSIRVLFSPKIIFAGLLLGIPNYLSYWFILKALDAFQGRGDVVFPAGNLLVILLSSFFSILLFKEQPGFKTWIGLGLSVFSLVFLIFSFLY
jgi:drug/metabolite transporter (DMT)-like permease